MSRRMRNLICILTKRVIVWKTGQRGKERVETLFGRLLQCSGGEEMVALIKLPVLVVRKCHIWIYCEENVDSLFMLIEKINELMLNSFEIFTEILNSGFLWHCKESSLSLMPPELYYF